MKIGLLNTGLDETAPPLNLAYLAASLKSKGFNEVKIIDRTFYPWRNLLKEIKGCDLIAISAITKFYKRACRMAEIIKKSSSIPVIIGGVHISMSPLSLSPDFALGVAGEGEDKIVEICESFSREGNFLHEKLKEIPGLVYREGARLIETEAQPPIENVDNIPMPDFSLLDRHYFRKKWINWSERRGRSMHIITSRGCPYTCVFCAATRFWKKTRFYSPGRVFDEVNELVYKWGIDHIYIDDDLFLGDKKRLREITGLLHRGNLTGKIMFSCTGRTNLLDDETCRILKKMGVKSLNFGFESGSDRVLKYLKGDNIRVEDHKKAIRLCNRHGFKVYGSLMLGSPAETAEDMEKTLDFMDFAIKNKCHKIFTFVATPLPGTPFWEIAKTRHKVSDEMDWDKLDLNSYDNHMLLNPDVELSEFKKLFNKATRKANKAWMKDKWLKTLILERGKVIRRTLDNPARAFGMFKDVFLK